MASVAEGLSALQHGLDLWRYDGTLDRVHYELYTKCRELEGRALSPTVATGVSNCDFSTPSTERLTDSAVFPELFIVIIIICRR